MADCAEDSEDATSSVGDEEKVKRLFQACDEDGDGFIDSHDLVNVCTKLKLEFSIQEIMKELGADEQGRISYQEFFKRSLALGPEIEALKNNTPLQLEYMVTSSENSLGEEKMSWEFDSGARDLSPEPHSLKQLITSISHPGSGNLLDLANKLHVAALASLKNEISQLSKRLQNVIQERDHLEKSLLKAEIKRQNAEQKLEEEKQLHEEQLTELHSVIAELTRKVQYLKTLVIREEEDVSETDDNNECAISDCSNAHPLEEEEEKEIKSSLDKSARSNENEKMKEAVDSREENLAALTEELARVKADNAMLNERLNRALSDLETISQLNNKKQMHQVPEIAPEIVQVARVSSPSSIVCHTSPPLTNQKVTSTSRNGSNQVDGNLPVPKIAERVSLKKISQTKVAHQSVSNVGGESNFQDVSGGETLTENLLELENDRLVSKLEHVRAQNAVLVLTLEECKAQCDRLSLLMSKYESNALALKLALDCSDRCLQVAESLIYLLETELHLFTSHCRTPYTQIQQNSTHSNQSETEEKRFFRKATENRKKAERHAKEVLNKILHVQGNGIHSEWNATDETKLKSQLNLLKSERNLIRTTVVELESPHVEPIANVSSSSEVGERDLETAVLVEDLMNMQEEKAELRVRMQFLEKERTSQEWQLAAQNSYLQALLQSISHLQALINEDKENSNQESVQKRDSRLKQRMEELVGTLDKVIRSSELRHQKNSELVLQLKEVNTALVSTLDNYKKKYQGRIKKLETEMLSMAEQHADHVRKLKHRLAIFEGQIQYHAAFD